MLLSFAPAAVGADAAAAVGAAVDADAADAVAAA